MHLTFNTLVPRGQDPEVKRAVVILVHQVTAQVHVVLLRPQGHVASGRHLLGGRCCAAAGGAGGRPGRGLKGREVAATGGWGEGRGRYGTWARGLLSPETR